MKQMFILFAALMVFSLTACAGSGGGNGGESNADPFSTPAPSMSLVMGGAASQGKVSADFSEIPAAGGLKAAAGNGGIKMIPDFAMDIHSFDILYKGIVVAKFESGPNGHIELYNNGVMGAVGDITPELRAAINSSDEFEDKEGHYANLVEDYHGKRTLTFNGDISYHSHSAIMNAVVPLEHSAFGEWIVWTDRKGTINDGEVTREVDMHMAQFMPVYGVDTVAVKVTPDANDAFTGRAIAYAYAPGDNYTKFDDAMLFGDVTMRIDNTGNNANASLTFDEYYKIDCNNLVVATGDYAGQVVVYEGISQIAIDNTLGADSKGFAIDANNLEEAYFDGTFYKRTDNGKEGIGEFGFVDQAGNGVYGSFGMVKD